jgi:hypothetical protein
MQVAMSNGLRDLCTSPTPRGSANLLQGAAEVRRHCLLPANCQPTARLIECDIPNGPTGGPPRGSIRHGFNHAAGRTGWSHGSNPHERHAAPGPAATSSAAKT